MTTFAPHEIIPDAYRGREQAYIKHVLLEGYLERLLYIVGWNASSLGHSEIVYVDCFSGPWQDDSEDLSSTSIAISLKLLSNVQMALAAKGKIVRFRAIYVELDTTSYARLSDFLSKHSPPNVQTLAIHGNFVAKIPNILAALRQDSFAFFFIDPKGYLEIKPSVLQPLLKRPRSEFLINFMYDFVNRFVLTTNGSELFDGTIDADGIPDEPAVRERFLVEAYRTAIVARAHTEKFRAMSAYVTILDPRKDRTKYHLLYLTRHPLGIVEFMEKSEVMSGVQDAVRAAVKLEKEIEKARMDDMFGLDTDQTSTSAANVKHIESYLLELVGNGPLTVDLPAFAKVLSQTNCFPIELQTAVRNLVMNGEVAIPGINIARRPKNIINYEKSEQLHRCAPCSST